MNYQTFYGKYGKNKNAFKKRKNSEDNLDEFRLKPDILVEVVETGQTKNLKGARSSNLPTYRDHPR